MQRQYGLHPQITAVEIDLAIIDSLKFWNKTDLEKTEIIQGDAFEIIKNLKPGYNLIIVDLFIDLDVHPQIHSKKFIEQIKFLLAHEGKILINYVVNTNLQKQEFAEFQLLLLNYFKEIKGHEVMNMNRVLELKT